MMVSKYPESFKNRIDELIRVGGDNQFIQKAIAAEFPSYSDVREDYISHRRGIVRYGRSRGGPKGKTK